MPSRKTSPAFQRAFHIIANSPAWIPSGLYNCGLGERCKQDKKLPSMFVGQKDLISGVNIVDDTVLKAYDTLIVEMV